MAKFLIALTQKGDQEILKKWLEDRYICILPDTSNTEELSRIILKEEYDLGFVDWTVLNTQKKNIQKRKSKEYPILLPFIYVTPHVEERIDSELWITVDEILKPPVKRLELYMRTEKLLGYRRMTLTLHHIAVTDHLTGFFNHRYLIIIGNQEFQQAIRYNRPLSVIFMDIDHFKKINDTYGHLVGNQVIRAVARRCYLNIRAADIAGRYGGEEFVFILPETTAEKGAVLAERLRRIISEEPIIANGNQIPVTASFGVAQLDKNMSSINSLLGKADQALLRAKQKGRNRVEVIY